MYYRFVAVLPSGASSALEAVQIFFCECVGSNGECQFLEPDDDYDTSMEFVKVVCDCTSEYVGMLCFSCGNFVT